MTGDDDITGAPGGRIRLCRLDELEPETVRAFEVAGRRLSVIRLDDEVFVIGDRCSHANVSLSEGELDPGARTIECWRHGALFSIESGAALTPPASKAVASYQVVVADGEVSIVVDEPATSQ